MSFDFCFNIQVIGSQVISNWFLNMTMSSPDPNLVEHLRNVEWEIHIMEICSSSAKQGPNLYWRSVTNDVDLFSFRSTDFHCCWDWGLQLYEDLADGTLWYIKAVILTRTILFKFVLDLSQCSLSDSLCPCVFFLFLTLHFNLILKTLIFFLKHDKTTTIKKYRWYWRLQHRLTALWCPLL